MIPARARERLLDIASTQLPTGGAYHQYQPLTKRGNNDVGSGFNDDPAWLVLAVAAYLKETGDASILDEAVPYDNEPGTERPLYEHLQRSIGYTLERLGPHGLPLIGRADWNDCLNLNCFSETPGRVVPDDREPERRGRRIGLHRRPLRAGGRASSPRSPTSARTTPRPRAARSARRRDARRRSTRHGWDGAWFRRAYDFFGRPVGSAENDEGQIFIEPQGMCVMAGIGLDDGRAAARPRLGPRAPGDAARDRGAPAGVHPLPPAPRRDLDLSRPGYKENAGVFCHTNPWVMIAETMVGNGDGAIDYYLRINPSAREAISEIHRCEPYVYAQMIAGKRRRDPRRGQELLADRDGRLELRRRSASGSSASGPSTTACGSTPACPPTGAASRVTRRFRGATYRIAVRKAPGTPGRVTRLLVDGRERGRQPRPAACRPGDGDRGRGVRRGGSGDRRGPAPGLRVRRWGRRPCASGHPGQASAGAGRPRSADEAPDPLQRLLELLVARRVAHPDVAGAGRAEGAARDGRHVLLARAAARRRRCRRGRSR